MLHSGSKTSNGLLTAILAFRFWLSSWKYSQRNGRTKLDIGTKTKTILICSPAAFATRYVAHIHILRSHFMSGLLMAFFLLLIAHQLFPIANDRYLLKRAPGYPGGAGSTPAVVVENVFV